MSFSGLFYFLCLGTRRSRNTLRYLEISLCSLNPTLDNGGGRTLRVRPRVNPCFINLRFINPRVINC